MIALARQRAGDTSGRVNFYVSDIRTFEFAARTSYDLVAAHFFLDCLSQSEVAELFHRIQPHLAPGATCVISEFAVPPHEPVRSIARLLIWSLYLAFRVLTGLATRRIPDYGVILRNTGFFCEEATPLLGGILHSERWRLADSPGNEDLPLRLPPV